MIQHLKHKLNFALVKKKLEADEKNRNKLFHLGEGSN